MSSPQKHRVRGLLLLTARGWDGEGSEGGGGEECRRQWSVATEAILG